MYQIRTFTGRYIRIDQPDPAVVDVVDIAHHLASINRFCGAVETPYNVGQHSVVGSYSVPAAHALEFLLHDAPEAYMGDLTRGTKAWVNKVSGGAWSRLEAEWADAIHKALGVESTPFSQAVVKSVDDRIVVDELMEGMFGWEPDENTKAPLGVDVRPWSAVESEKRFLLRFKALAA